MRLSRIPLFIFASVSILLGSCRKEGFPSVEDLAGTWVEYSPQNDTLIFRSNRSLIRISDGRTDTLIFRTDGDEGTLSISNPADPADGESVHFVNFLGGLDKMQLTDYRVVNGEAEYALFNRK